ncbi:DUF2169 domain-containing protein [Burkholderia ubonensis]|nr:DUF2169 domain-containing protein [Burkholderia ubonensis]KVM04249.1 hypothetical protein WJ52_31155 [Burkholderia ubonensis]KVM57049.1 hypothetical protein WJ56_03085 [Burkholderia ubonensis]KVO15310.1 hypothetical protein WJ72_12570 [Burkholderia ubonensis]KVO28586.1 hypothetical protein WJ76_26700 [Burkholderia ubonensis]KVR23782.1 hypothetical protein WK14_16035 [Burkholderia ubonensis]
MLQLQNVTPFAAERAVQFDRQGGHLWVVVVKATYDLHADGTLSLSKRQEPVNMHPEYFGEPGHSTLRRDAEIVFAHPGTAVMVNGSACAPGGELLRELDVGISVGPVRRVLRIFGTRYWEAGFFGLRMTEPEPFSRWPLRYEFAYGGTSPRHGERFSDNPVGMGFFVDRDDARDGKLPHIEDPDCLIKSWKDRPTPAGMNAIPPVWPARARFGGTTDEQWITTRAPLVPDDFDVAFFNAASPGMTTDTPLRGGERVVLVNLAPSARTVFRLPRVHFNLLTTMGGRTVRQHAQLDRVIVEPDDGRLVMVWRSILACGREARRVQVTYVDTKKDLHTGRFHGV